MTQEFVTLPREVVERALKVLEYAANDVLTGRNAATALRAALEQPHTTEQSYMGCVTSDMHELAEWLHTMHEDAKEQVAALEQPQNHIPGVRNMVPTGWKLVPVEPTDDMLYDIQEFSHILPPRGKRIWAHMLAAAPQPPTVKESLTVEQPQVEQPAMTPIAQRKLDSLITEGYTISGYSVYHERKHQHGFVTGAGLVGWWKPDGMEYPQPQGDQGAVGFVRQVDIERLGNTPSDWASMFGQATGYNTVPVYTHPQPKRKPLTVEQIDAIADAMPGGLEGFMKGWGWRQFASAVIEATHNIK